jgi:acetylglutamate kinase
MNIPVVKPLVIKIGGAILEKESALTALLVAISQLKNKQVVLVHGGGCVVDEMLAQAGFTTQKKTGVTSDTQSANRFNLRCFGWDSQ